MGKKQEKLLRILKYLFKNMYEYQSSGKIKSKNIPFIVYGTLLGYHRDDGICEGDKDLDLGILKENFDEVLLKEMFEALGFDLVLANNCIKNKDKSYRIKSDKDKVVIDLTVFNDKKVIDENDKFLKYDHWNLFDEFCYLEYWVSDGWTRPHQIKYYPKEIFKKSFWEFEKFNSPIKILPYDDAVVLFEIEYGKTWKIPMKRDNVDYLNREKVAFKRRTQVMEKLF